jgi:hypothetical protein
MSEMVSARTFYQFSTIQRPALQNTTKNMFRDYVLLPLPRKTRCGTPTHLGPEGDYGFTCCDQLSAFPLPSVHEDGHTASDQFLFKHC